MGRRKRLLTKKTSKEDGILVVGLDSSDSSGSTLTNSAKLLLLCPAAACLLRLLLLSDVTQWALRIDFTKKIVNEIIFKFRKVDFTDKIGTDYFWIYLKNDFTKKIKMFLFTFLVHCVWWWGCCCRPILLLAPNQKGGRFIRESWETKVILFCFGLRHQQGKKTTKLRAGMSVAAGTTRQRPADRRRPREVYWHAVVLWWRWWWCGARYCLHAPFSKIIFIYRKEYLEKRTTFH